MTIRFKKFRKAQSIALNTEQFEAIEYEFETQDEAMDWIMQQLEELIW